MAVTFVILSYLFASAAALCCDFTDDNWINLGCKSYGSCNFFCCNCDDICKVDGCNYQLNNSKIDIVTEPEEIISNTLGCYTGSKKDCILDYTVEKSFKWSFNASLEGWAIIPFEEAVEFVFHTTIRGSVADQTTTGVKIKCPIPQGHKGWVSQIPRYARLTADYIYVCWSAEHGELVKARKPFHKKMPLVLPSGLDVGDLFCHSVSENGTYTRTKVVLEKAI